MKSASQTNAPANYGSLVDVLQSASHPVAAFFHIFFKGTVLVVYLVGNQLFNNSFISIFVACVIIAAFDFWTVKNVTGRLLVGLRWWNDILEDGSNVWRFESIPNPDSVSTVDYRIFWYSLYCTEVVWALLAFVTLLKLSLEWLFLISIILALNTSNISGFWKCSTDAQKRLREGVNSYVSSGAVSFLTSGAGNVGSFFSKLAGSNSATPEFEPISVV